MPDPRTKATGAEARFPVMHSGGATVPWSLVEPHREQAQINHWEYFVDRIVWDAETEPYWGDDAGGWDLNDELWFRGLPAPPTETTDEG